MPKEHNKKTSKKWSVAVFSLCSFLIVSLSAAYYHLYYPEKNKTSEQEEKQKAAQFNPAKNSTMVFRTKAFGNMENTFVSIPMLLENEIPELWLNVSTNSPANIINIPISHPILQNLEWNKIESADKKLTLYQKNINYESVEDFLNQAPKNAVIVADGALISKRIAPNNSKELKREIDLEATDYILTAFKTQRIHEKNQNIHYSQNFLDLSDVVLTNNNEIEWTIIGPTISEENPLLIGNIHVDYR